MDTNFELYEDLASALRQLAQASKRTPNQAQTMQNTAKVLSTTFPDIPD